MAAGRLVARVKNAERIMTQATVTETGIEIAFADGCRGIVPFSAIPEVENAANLTAIDLPNPYLVNIRDAGGETVELPWDFVRHYCDSSYRPKAEVVAAAGTRALGQRIRTLRKAAEMTQSGLSGAAGIGRVTLVRIESGEQSPRYETLLAIARALGRGIGDLTGGDFAGRTDYSR